MGLCKCPQRKVTNIFCYEHRVNVCEHCLMQNHTKCVVDTYRNWITDSVFSPKCSLCSDDLVNGDTVRLLCFHIVHWECLDSYARSLPATTAPAGYTCPVCKRMCLFPALNQISPIADAIRSKLGAVNWARAGLGMPLLHDDSGNSSAIVNGTAGGLDDRDGSLSENFNKTESKLHNSDSKYPNNTHESALGAHQSMTSVMNYAASSANQSNPVEPSTSYASTSNASFASAPSPSTKSFYNNSDMSIDQSSITNPRKPVNKFDYTTPLLFDEDDNKYRRKSPFEALSRWLKNANPATNRRKSRKRTIIYAIVTIVVLIVMFMILFGRNDEYDDGFDPKLNPNVFIGDREAVAKSHDDS